MKKIGIYLSNEPYSGGAFQYNQSMLDALDSLDSKEYQIYVFYADDLWLEYLEKYRFKAVRLKGQKHDFWGRVVLKFCRCMKINIATYKNLFSLISHFSKEFDVHGLNLLICPAQEILPAYLRTPCIATIHDLMHRYETGFSEISNPDEYRWREYQYKNICLSAELIFVDSEIGKKHVLESYGEKYENKIRVMPFTPPQYLFQEAEDKNGIHFDLPNKFVFYPAQFWMHKNHKNLILAIDKLQKRGVDIDLVLVGSCKNGYEEILQIIREKGLESKVQILGYISDQQMKEMYQKARAMIMPSFCGPTNIPPLEAMAMGCPVAVSAVYGMPEQIGDAGLTFNPHDINDIASVLERLWKEDDLCNRLSINGLERAKNFSQENFNEKFWGIIEKFFDGGAN